MSTVLSPRPNFNHLRHQAKDLLRLHERRDASVCEILRRLNRFASVDDDRIFGSPLALNEAQYALALHYGFSSWNAMKRYVEHVTGRPIPVKREKNRAFVTGLENYPIGDDGIHENSVIAAIAGVMSALGEENLTYYYLMGVSGAAFRLQMATPVWCPSAACAPCGYNCVPGVLKATGYRINWIPTQRKGEWLKDGIEKALQAIPQSVERGIPVILSGEEAGLIVGYYDDKKLMVRPYAGGRGCYKDADVFGAAAVLKQDVIDVIGANMAWDVGIVEPQDIPADRHESIVESLRLAVKLAKTEKFGAYMSGFAAYRFWIDGLLDDSIFDKLTDDNWFGWSHGNGYCYGCLWACRYTAEKYLREISDDFNAPVKKRLQKTADIYKKIYHVIGKKRPEYECSWSLMPWKIGSPEKWTPELRKAETQALEEALSYEKEAISMIEDVLNML